MLVQDGEALVSPVGPLQDYLTWHTLPFPSVLWFYAGQAFGGELVGLGWRDVELLL
jgi:hypothetical protein